ncbi:TonB-dependent receptor [Dyadobacter tibetensis]|uniref:TonB-dependent receptor n=1 Tax=Dyadobacter tibetensis TaxID=1211851 RepID=UPI00047111E3|nr:TonB-dependent receptor [Dyadobacter tibetensis]
MAKKYIPSLLLLFIIAITNGHGQGTNIKGNVLSKTDSTALPGATVTIQKENGKIEQGVMANQEGAFQLIKVQSGAYILKVSYMGFQTYTKDLLLVSGQQQTLEVLLEEEANTLTEVKIVGQLSAGEQIGDSTQYNADAFKTTADASAQELIEKLPGITIENGKVQAQGEPIQQILVDGKMYFGSDVAKALQNLPAEVIQSIQLFDKKSDKSELSGFDDGNQIKTINIVTKPNRRNGQFGKASAGLGTDHRYAAGASVNHFNEDMRLTFTGLTNNVNTTTYQTGQGSQDEDRPSNGVIVTNSLGVNYSGNWSPKLEASGSYSYTNSHNTSLQTKFRTYANPADSGRAYTEQNTRIDEDRIHRAEMRIDYKITDRDRLLIRPNFSLVENDDFSHFTGRTVNESAALNQTENQSKGKSHNLSFSNSMVYSHRFEKPGRSVSIKLNTAYRTNDFAGTRVSENVYFRQPDRNKILNQYTRFDKSGFSWEGEVSYSEPLGNHGRMQLGHERGNRRDDSDRQLFDYQDLENAYDSLNIGLSNTFKSDYLTEQTELTYQYRKEKVRLQISGKYEVANLQNEQKFPTEYSMRRTFRNTLPAARLEYRFSKTQNLQLDFRTSTDAPSINELQQVVNISNPLYVRSGNPNLVQSVRNRLQAKYRTQNSEKSRTFFAMLETSVIPNFQTNSTFTARHPIALTVTDTLQTGSQMTMPINMSGYWTVNSYFNYGQPFNFIKSKVSFNGQVNHTQLPSMIDSLRNMTYTTNFRVGTTISSNVSENLDFQVSSRSGYNMVKRTLRETQNNSFSQTSRIRLTWIIWKGLVYRSDVIHQLNSGLSAGFNTNYTIWNMSIGKKILPNNRGEISLNVFDLLKQNVSVKRYISDSFVQDTQSNVLQRYFLLTFTYNIRRFPDGAEKGQLGKKPQH